MNNIQKAGAGILAAATIVTGGYVGTRPKDLPPIVVSHKAVVVTLEGSTVLFNGQRAGTIEDVRVNFASFPDIQAELDRVIAERQSEPKPEQ